MRQPGQSCSPITLVPVDVTCRSNRVLHTRGDFLSVGVSYRIVWVGIRFGAMILLARAFSQFERVRVTRYVGPPYRHSVSANAARPNCPVENQDQG